MTPLEELQAAHKRLDEIRKFSSENWRVSEGRLSAVKVIAEYGEEIAYVAEPFDAHAIVTLHSTINAQMALLEERIRLAETTQYWQNPDATLEPFSIKPDAQTLALARAINGGTDA